MLEFAILALQGSFSLHQRRLEAAGASTRLVTHPDQLQDVDALVIPGGESTTILKLMTLFNWRAAITNFHQQGKLIFGTCAGMILLSKQVEPKQFCLGLIDIHVERNAYGRQLDSFINYGINHLDQSSVKMACIRAPKVTFVGKTVETIASLGKQPMMLRQRNVIVASFHTELVDDLSLYYYLIKNINEMNTV